MPTKVHCLVLLFNPRASFLTEWSCLWNARRESPENCWSRHRRWSLDKLSTIRFSIDFNFQQNCNFWAQYFSCNIFRELLNLSVSYYFAIFMFFPLKLLSSFSHLAWLSILLEFNNNDWIKNHKIDWMELKNVPKLGFVTSWLSQFCNFRPIH